MLKPGGRLVVGDMMFSLNPIQTRDRRVVIVKLRLIARRGLPGIWRLLKNAARLLTGRWGASGQRRLVARSVDEIRLSSRQG